jgi:hypothetical protein
MLVKCDDELYRLDRVYLGPKGKPLPLRLTYRAWSMLAGLMFVMITVWRRLGLPWNLMMFLLLAAGCYFVAGWLDRLLTSDRPLFSELQRIVQEIFAPRPTLENTAMVYVAAVRVPRWSAVARPAPRWWQRRLTMRPKRARRKKVKESNADVDTET